jgi:hypothetical protein
MRIPNLSGAGSPTTSSTFKHLDAVFSALSLLASYLKLNNIEAFLTALQTSYQRVCYMININPESTISELKRVRMDYISWIRGGPVPTAVPILDENDEVHVRIGAQDNKTPVGLSYIHEENILSILCIQSLVDFKISLHKNTDKNIIRLIDILVIAFLDINRVIVLPYVKDLSTITDGHSSQYGKEVHTPNQDITVLPTPMGDGGAKLTHDIPGKVEAILAEWDMTPSKLKAAYKAKCRAQKPIIISSAGPNGDSTWTAYSDARALLMNKSVIQPLNSFAIASGLKRFVKMLIATVQLKAVDIIPETSVKLGKIITFAEWGGKTRHVASLDYWTQLIMTPLHDTLFDLLKSIPEDATFDQDAASDVIREWTSNPAAELNSFDLTAATDRLPLSLQGRILNNMLGMDAIGHHWVNIFANRTYYDVDNLPVKYSVGGPMGSKSNWAMLALTHHIIVKYSAILCGLQFFRDYRICGDDIVINNPTVAGKYKEVVAYLGLSINEKKSILSSESLSPAAEFCKRVFVNGFEYTGLTTKLIAKVVMNGRLLPQLQNELVKRGFTLPGHSLFNWMGALVDPQSHGFLAVLNLLPTMITGLLSKIDLPSRTPALSTWWAPKYVLTENDMVQAYTYVAAVEQLKRLDALLRQTVMVTDTIASATAASYNITLDSLEWAKDPEAHPFLKQLKKYTEDLSPAHPIVEASQLEAIRISLLLTKISNGSMSIESAARGKLLDMFRNSLASMWSDEDAAKAQADRTLVTKALDVVETLVTNLEDRMAPDALLKAKTAIFSTKLQHFERNWTIRWVLGSNVTVNTVKTRVVQSVSVADVNADAIIRSLPITRKTRV